MFFGLGSDGTVGANKASVKIIGEGTDSSPRATSSTTPRSRARSPSRTCASGREPIRSTTSSRRRTSSPATSSACSTGRDPGSRQHGATFLLNAPYGPDEVWEHLPGHVQRQIVDKEIDLWVIDAFAVADEVGMGSRINTVMQPCFFRSSGILPADEASRASRPSSRRPTRSAARPSSPATSPPSTAPSNAREGDARRRHRGPAGAPAMPEGVRLRQPITAR